MNERSSLQTIIKKAALSWPKVQGSGDTNTVDVYWHACKIVELLNLKLPTKLPQRDIGVHLVECVEDNFISGETVRNFSPQHIAKRGKRLAEIIRDNGLLTFEEHESYSIALYNWHGCLNMAKLLRKTYNISGGEAPYSLEIRRQGFNQLQKDYRNEDFEGNPWVRYGMSLAKLLEEKRGNQVIDEWIPSDSPYWNFKKGEK